MTWPKESVILAALRGISEVFAADGGQYVRGFKSGTPHVFAVAPLVPGGPPGLVVCEHCETYHPFPEPPAGGGESAGPRTPLLAVNTLAYVHWLLATTLNPFYKEHSQCEQAQNPLSELLV